MDAKVWAEYHGENILSHWKERHKGTTDRKPKVAFKTEKSWSPGLEQGPAKKAPP